MTALCGGGPSQPVPGQQILQQLTAEGVIEYLTTEGWQWYASLAYGVGYLAYDLTGLCATDPPPLPNVDAARVFSYVASTQGAQFLREDATAIVAHLLWYQYCQCVSGPQPTPPPPLPAPTGIQVNNPATQKASGGNCMAWSPWQIAGTMDGNGTQSQLMQSNNPVLAQVQWAQMTVSGGNSTDLTVYPAEWTFDMVGSDGVTSLARQSFTQDAPLLAAAPRVLTFPWPPNALSILGRVSSVTAANKQFSIQALPLGFCSAAPLAVQQPCCPPDANLIQLITTILQNQNLMQTTINELLAPKQPYVDSTVHAGLTGNGTIRIAPTAAAIRVDITTRPNPWPSGKTDPAYLFSIGFITPFAVGTPLRGSRLVYDHQIYTYPSYTDQIGYALELGVTVSIVELVVATPPASPTQGALGGAAGPP